MDSNNKINFFTSISFGDLSRTKTDYLLEAFDQYLAWGNHQAVVLKRDGITGLHEVEFQSFPSKRQNLCTTFIKIIKVLSYIPFGLPALLIKKVLRSSYAFTIVTKNPTSPTKTTPAPNLNTSMTEVLKTRLDEIERMTCPVARKTGMATTQGFYLTPSGKIILLHSGEELLQKSCHYPNSLEKSSKPKIYPNYPAVVVPGDCLEVAEYELQTGAKKVAVLMLASPIEPGGAMEDGNNGQEEDLCRRSDIFGFMWEQSHFLATRPMYNLVDVKIAHEKNPNYSAMTNNRMLHVPNVTVFRAGRNKDYAMLEKPFEVGMLASPGLDRPEYERTNGVTSYKRKEDEEQLQKLIMTQLRAAHHEGYDTVVLGAFGCGAFYNPPELVAEFYKKIIDENFKGAFRKIVFAILDDRGQVGDEHNPIGNLQPFATCFGTKIG